MAHVDAETLPKRNQRAHGTGTVGWDERRRRWLAKITIAGKRHSIAFSVLQYGSKAAAHRAAEQRLQELAVDSRRGDLLVLPGNSPLVSNEITEYIKGQAGILPQTIRAKERRLRKLVADKPELRVADLTTEVLADFFRRIREEHAPKEFRHIRTAVKSFVDELEWDGHIGRRQVHWKRLNSPPLQPQRHHLFQVVGTADDHGVSDERMRFLETAGQGEAGGPNRPPAACLVALFSVMAFEAIGPGEAAGTTWADISTDFSTIKVNRTSREVSERLQALDRRLGYRDLQALAKEFASGRTSTKRPSRVRTLLLSEFSSAALRAWRAIAPQDAVLLFPRADGGPERLQNIDNMCRRICRAAQIPVHAPTDFRHTAITIALAYTTQADGISPTDVSRWAGHANATITLNAYSHELASAPGLLAALAQFQPRPPTALGS